MPQPKHFSDVICPFRGAYWRYSSDEDCGWSDEWCVGPQCAKWKPTEPADVESPAGFCANGTPDRGQILRAELHTGG